jgi:hypothetical protein
MARLISGRALSYSPPHILPSPSPSPALHQPAPSLRSPLLPIRLRSRLRRIPSRHRRRPQHPFPCATTPQRRRERQLHLFRWERAERALCRRGVYQDPRTWNWQEVDSPFLSVDRGAAVPQSGGRPGAGQGDGRGVCGEGMELEFGWRKGQGPVENRAWEEDVGQRTEDVVRGRDME